MQFVVIGAGSMGCVYGGNLARIGQHVTFIDVWQDHVDSIRVNGLSLEGLTGNFTVRVQATTDAGEAPQADAVLICVNAYDTPQAARSAAAVIKDDGFCLTLQNGVGNIEVLTDALGPRRVLAGLSFQSGDLQGPATATVGSGPISPPAPALYASPALSLPCAPAPDLCRCPRSSSLPRASHIAWPWASIFC